MHGLDHWITLRAYKDPNSYVFHCHQPFTMSDNIPTPTALSPRSLIKQHIRDGLQSMRNPFESAPATPGSTAAAGAKRASLQDFEFTHSRSSSPINFNEPSAPQQFTSQAERQFNYSAYAKTVVDNKKRKVEHANELYSYADVSRFLLTRALFTGCSHSHRSARFCSTT